MAKGYWIVRIDVTDPEVYGNYVKAIRDTVTEADILIVEGYDGPQPGA